MANTNEAFICAGTETIMTVRGSILLDIDPAFFFDSQKGFAFDIWFAVMEDSNEAFLLRFRDGTGLKIKNNKFSFADQNRSYPFQTVSCTPHQFCHICVSFRSGDIIVYKDGTYAETITLQEPIAFTTETLALWDSKEPSFFRSVRMYNAHVSQEELTALLFAKTIAAPADKLLAWYDFSSAVPSEISGRSYSIRYFHFVPRCVSASCLFEANASYTRTADTVDTSSGYGLYAHIRCDPPTAESHVIFSRAGTGCTLELRVDTVLSDTDITHYLVVAANGTELKSNGFSIGQLTESWLHAGVVCTGSETKLYVDGKLHDTKNSPPLLTASCNVVIGGVSCFPGSVNVIAEFSRLTEEQIKGFLESPPFLFDENICRLYRFDGALWMELVTHTPLMGSGGHARLTYAVNGQTEVNPYGYSVPVVEAPNEYESFKALEIAWTVRDYVSYMYGITPISGVEADFRPSNALIRYLAALCERYDRFEAVPRALRQARGETIYSLLNAMQMNNLLYAFYTGDFFITTALLGINKRLLASTNHKADGFLSLAAAHEPAVSFQSGGVTARVIDACFDNASTPKTLRVTVRFAASPFSSAYDASVTAYGDPRYCSRTHSETHRITQEEQDVEFLLTPERYTPHYDQCRTICFLLKLDQDTLYRFLDFYTMED